jgi:esterase/lipase superfamily enzyme
VTERTLYFATNRKHNGNDRWKPESYGTDFSSDGRENLRFGKATIRVKEKKVDDLLKTNTPMGVGNGEALAKYFTRQARFNMTISAFREQLDPSLARSGQQNAVYGSTAMFEELRQVMLDSHDVLVFIHGFNVSWTDAVGSALSLQEMLNRARQYKQGSERATTVVLFSWPSDGKIHPFHSYRSDRRDAEDSGLAVGRAMLTLRDFLVDLRTAGSKLCNRELHLLCHSMGNYVLQHALAKMVENSSARLARMFEHVFLCAPDVDDDVLEPTQGMARLHEITRNITVYYNKGDAALRISDYTKGNPDRLGNIGMANPSKAHAIVHQVDCSAVARGVIEHGYYLTGKVNHDIQASVDGNPQHPRSDRATVPGLQNTWVVR